MSESVASGTSTLDYTSTGARVAIGGFLVSSSHGCYLDGVPFSRRIAGGTPYIVSLQQDSARRAGKNTRCHIDQTFAPFAANAPSSPPPRTLILRP